MGIGRLLDGKLFLPRRLAGAPRVRLENAGHAFPGAELSELTPNRHDPSDAGAYDRGLPPAQQTDLTHGRERRHGYDAAL
jgi:hypothetical protein